MERNNIFFKVNEEEKIKILKPLLTKYFNENDKLDERGISKCDYLPSFKTIIKVIKSQNNYNYGITDSYLLYNFLGVEPNEIYCKRYFNRNQYVYEEIKTIFEENDCVLLSKSFNNINDNVDYICSCGNQSVIQIVSFLNGHRCMKCSIERRAEKRKLPFEEVKNYYETYNCILLSKKSEYKNKNSVLKFICSCGEEYEISFSSFISTHNCKKCGLKKCSGENHYCWKGGITPLHEYLRRHIYQWKFDSMKMCDFKCVITEDKFDEIHHLTGFEIILQKTLNQLDLTIKENISDYTNDELTLLKDKCIELHYKYGLGVCLTKDVHLLFHKIYGNKNNTPEQFYQFETDYLSGKLNNLKEELK